VSATFIVSAPAQAATENAKLVVPSESAFPSFGSSVAIDGDTAVVGATYDGATGSAYVFVRSDGAWTQQAELVASDGADYANAVDDFGSAVAIDGDTVVVGARRSDLGCGRGEGSAYVFVRSGSTWTQQAKLWNADRCQNDAFGYSVAVEGDTVVVGSPGSRDASDPSYAGATNRGVAFVFTRTEAVWTRQARLQAPDNDNADQFGYAVALNGGSALVGAPYSNNYPGAAYVFVGAGAAWTVQAKLTASDGTNGDFFGFSVDLDGNTALVGAGNDMGVYTNAAYVFVRSDGTWTQQAKLTGSVASTYSQFGFSVAVEGNTAVVGAYFDDVGETPYPGSAYVFARSGTTWVEQDRLTASDGASSDNFGYSVALDSGTALVGAPLHDVSDGTTVAQDAGAAYIFVLVSDGDNDGVIDANDSCPTQSGPANNNGCPLPPDTDNDGVIDANDSCPTESGPANNNGCPLPPDADNDGVIDANDSCPTQSGPANNTGCPVPPPLQPSSSASPTPTPSPSPTAEETATLPECQADPDAVCGTDGNDSLVIDASSDADGDGVVEVYLGAGDDTVCVQIGTGLSVIIHGQDGDDTVVVGDCGSRATSEPSGSVSGAAAPSPLDFSGGRGNDTFHGGADGETFRGGLGDDKATGSGGNDILRGGPNNDSIHGAAGADLVAGGLNDDELRGGAGRDTIKGGPGSDTLSGGPGTDTLDGGANQDTCLGAGDKLLRCE
jgi:hypothetical protein